jgi:hypothetical protein
MVSRRSDSKPTSVARSTARWTASVTPMIEMSPRSGRDALSCPQSPPTKMVKFRSWSDKFFFNLVEIQKIRSPADCGKIVDVVRGGTLDLTMPRRRRRFPSSDDSHRVVSFPSAKVRKTPWSHGPTHHRDPGLLLSLAKFERDDREGNYRHPHDDDEHARLHRASHLDGNWRLVDDSYQ